MWRIFAIAYGILLLLAPIAGLATENIPIPGDWDIDLGWLMVSALGVYTVASLRSVNKDEIGGLVFFGKPLKQIGPGLHFAPLGILRIETVPSTAIDIRIPGPQDKAYRGEDPPPPGMFVPVRITFKKSDGSADPLDQRITAELYIFVRAKIEDVMKFWPNIGTVDEFRKEIADTVISAASAILNQKTAAEALLSFEEISKVITTAIENLIGEDSNDPNGWGVNLLSARVEMICFNHSLNSALTDLPEKILGLQVIERTAEIEKKRLTLTGEGQANAARSLLEAEAEGLARKAEALKMEGKDLLALQTLMDALKEGKQVVISGPDGLSNLLKMSQAVLGRKE